MPTRREQIMIALRNADAAGDTEAAQRLAAMAKAEPWEPMKRNLEDIQREGRSAAAFKGNAADDMGFGETVMAGIGQSFDSALHKGNKLVHQLGGVLGMDNEEELARLDEETRDRRAIDQQLVNTPGGRTGQMIGDAGQAVLLTAATGGLGGAALRGASAIPGVARTGQAAARALPTATRAARSGAAKAIALDATAGGAQGALIDTTTDESTGENVAEQAAWGALFPGLGVAKKYAGPVAEATGLATLGRGALNALSLVPLPWIGSGAGHLLQRGIDKKRAIRDEFRTAVGLRNQEAREMIAAAKPATDAAKKAASRAEQAANQQARAEYDLNKRLIEDTVKKRAGADMQAIGRSYEVRSTPEMQKSIRAWKAGNQQLVKKYPDLIRFLDLAGMDNARMTGLRAQDLKAKLGALARDPKTPKKFQLPLHEMEREITDNIYRGAGPAKAKALREAFELSAKAHQGKLRVTGQKPMPQFVIPNVPQLNLPPMPLHPSQRPYMRGRGGTYGTAAGRGALMMRDEYEE